MKRIPNVQLQIFKFQKPSKKVLSLASVVLLVLSLQLTTNHYSLFTTHAIDPVDEIQKQINDLENQKKLSEDATKPLEQQVSALQQKVKNAQAAITQAKVNAEKLSENIEEREKDLADQIALFSHRVTESYKRTRTYSPLLVFFGQNDLKQITRDVAYKNSAENQDQNIIQSTASDILQLEKDKAKLEDDQKRLASLQVQLNEQKAFFDKEIGKAKEYQQVLSGKIASLSAQQQAIINARSGTFTTSVGDVPLADDFNASIGFKPQAPSNSFALFSFGGYTHRNGMSQYGAKARAEEGQSVEEILKAYYPNASVKKDYPAMGSINVQGHGSMSFEDQYLQGIYEMPGSWHPNALKAQAIAARTFAIKHTNNGSGSICTTEACQVFKNSKKGGEWEKAVNETKGWVLVDGGGSPVSTQYASSHGGFTKTAGWDTTDKSGGGDWTSRAWEKKANGPWFYKAWYRSGYTSSGANCGRNHPWLSQEEFSDIINAWIVRKNPGDADVNRIQPVTINQCNVGGGGGNPYSMSELRDKANGSGGAVTNVSSVSVSHSDNGQTGTVTLQTNRGTISISGSEFKEAFNLRAPGFLRIPQSSFAFFNIEHKQ